jgi:autophagy-related protein 18
MANAPLLPTDTFLSFSFNQDVSCLACGTSRGIQIYTLSPFAKAFETSDGGRSIVEMMYQTSLLATVGSGSHPQLSPRKLQLYNSSEMAQICEVNFASTILSVRLSKHRLVVVLRTKIHIFDVQSMKILRTIDIDDNPHGLCAMSYREDSCLLAFPKAAASGDIIIYDALHLHPLSVVKAHKSSIGYLQFNEQGSLLATCSGKGTLIRVFAMPNGEMLHSFRRGSYPATIYSVAFNANSDLLAVSSDSGTVHVYRINSPKNSQSGGSGGLGDDMNANGMMAPSSSGSSQGGSRGSGVEGGLVSGLWDMFESERDLARFKVATNQFHVVAISADDTKVFVVGKDGLVVVHALDPQRGGDCICIQEYDLRTM